MAGEWPEQFREITYEYIGRLQTVVESPLPLSMKIDAIHIPKKVLRDLSICQRIRAQLSELPKETEWKIRY